MRFRCLVLIMVLAACTASDGAVRLVCGDVHNQGGSEFCERGASSPAVVQRGEVSRKHVAYAEIVNPGPAHRWVYVSMEFDVPCNGANRMAISRWRLLVTYSTTLTLSVLNFCRDMPPGPHSLTVTVWDDVAEEYQATVLSRTTVHFTLLE